jgi:hypothetical protein
MIIFQSLYLIFFEKKWFLLLVCQQMRYFSKKHKRLIAPLGNSFRHMNEDVRYNMHASVFIGHGNRSEMGIDSARREPLPY